MIPAYLSQPARDQAEIPAPPFHRWVLPGSEPWAEFHRVPDGILVRFPGLADFVVPADGSAVLCWPVPGVGEATREHLYVNQVLPLILNGREGRITFHASAVVVDAGAIAFFGGSGLGKSTLAGGFVVAGHRFLTDDCLSVIERDGAFLVEPGHPSLRLWGDSEEAFAALDARKADAIEYSSKSRLLVGLRQCPEPQPLVASYFLRATECRSIRFSKIGGAEAAFEWLRNAFVLDVEERSALNAHFAMLVRLANAVPAVELKYPRSFDRLPDVVRAVSENASANGTLK